MSSVLRGSKNPGNFHETRILALSKQSKLMTWTTALCHKLWGDKKRTLLGTEYTEEELGEMSVFFNPPKLITWSISGDSH